MDRRSFFRNFYGIVHPEALKEYRKIRMFQYSLLRGA